VTFAVPADAYDRFMGRYASLLAPQLADFAGVHAGQRLLDVGCGPGALTSELVRRVSAGNVSAVDPSPTFVTAIRDRLPDIHVQSASAEALPFADGEFDAALAQLVVHFMADPVTGLTEMARVTRAGGTVAACVWDHAGGEGPLSLFWDAVAELDPAAPDESGLAGARDRHLVQLLESAGLHDVEQTVLIATVEHASFEAWWEPFGGSVGPAGAYAAGLDPQRRARLRELCRARIPSEPFSIAARAWAARGRA
jgi:ubiquinone/menaquinone biosynthesis C-methylase UbiE